MFSQLLNDPALPKELNLNPHTAIEIFFKVPPRNACHRLSYGVSRLFNSGLAGTGLINLWDKIDDQVILSAIPESAQCEEIINFAETKKMKPLGLIISVVDYFELGGNTLFLPPMATPEDWNAHKVEQFILPMLDRTADVPVECLILAIDKIRECEAKGKSIAIHCKAGKSRSAMLVAIYLAVSEFAKDEPETALKNAINKIQLAREQIGPDNKKIAKAIETIKAIRHIQKMDKNSESKEHKNENASLNTLDKLHTLLKLTSTKLAISQLPSFQKLAIYAAFHDSMFFGQTKRSNHIKIIFNSIYQAPNADWFLDYHNLTKPLAKADPSYVWDSGPNNSFGFGCVEADEATRKYLIDAFLADLITYLSKTLNCKAELIHNLVKPEQPATTLATTTTASNEKPEKLTTTLVTTTTPSDERVASRLSH